MLEDGEYDVFVVDAESGEGDATVLDVTVLAGKHKGEVVSLRAEGLSGEPITLLGLPGTLTVTDGRPSVALDR